jgi:protein gp37
MKTRNTRRGVAGKHQSTSELSVIDATALSTENQIELPADDIAALAQCESRIDEVTRSAYLDVGLMLKAIRDRKLYKVRSPKAVAGRYSFTTFEEYVEERWDMAIRRAYQMIEAADACSKMCTLVHILPARERYVRELLRIEGDDSRATVWQTVVGRGETITAKIVAEEVSRFLSSPADESYQPDDDEPEYEGEFSDEEEPVVVDCEEDDAAGHLIDDVEAESTASDQTRELLSIKDWESLSDSEADDFLSDESDATFNKQDTTSIEWAQWSWNPITGCKHDCPYCYARDIAKRFTNLYQNGFDPSIWPARFAAPANTTVPKIAEQDIAYRNVFTGSMADIFGRWVPEEWIRLVLDRVEQNPQWNFLFLTKFPQRVHEFGKLPKNAWMGTTVDCQERVANAEKAFAKMGGGIKWLSVEPMLTPLKFKRLDMFDWVVIGGASRSANTPAWVPPFDWVADLHAQARDAGCAVYHKDNLGMGDGIRLKEFPWEQRPDRELPEQLKYLSMK